MTRRNRRRFWKIGCLVTLFLMAGVSFWLLASTNQTPTMNIITQRTVLALHGPLRPNDEGVKAAWGAIISRLPSEEVPAWQVLKWLGVPREMTFAFYGSQPTPLGVFAINFSKGYRWLWLPLRIFGRHYKGAHYVITPHFVAGMYGGTAIVAEDEVIFCQAIDNFVYALKSKKKPLKLTRQLSNEYDFIGFVNPQLLTDSEHIQLPANLGEIGIAIVDANELHGSVFWVCQSEREAKGMVRALEQIEKEMVADYAHKGVQPSFQKSRKGMFVWWEFRLTNFMALLF